MIVKFSSIHFAFFWAGGLMAGGDTGKETNGPLITNFQDEKKSKVQ